MVSKITLYIFTVAWLALALITHLADPGNIFSLVSLAIASVYNAASHVIAYLGGKNES